jgi:Zn-finger nucleic acid-binding protein
MGLRTSAKSIPDDAGRSVSLWTPWGEQKDSLPKEVRERITVALADRLSPRQRRALGCSTSLAVVLFTVLLTLVPWLALIVAIPLIVVLVGAGRWTTLRRGAGEIRATLLAMRCCASCGYDMTGVPPGHRGLTQCPECRAVWRIASGEREDGEGGRGDPAPGDRPPWRWNRLESLLISAGLGLLLAHRSCSCADDRGRVVEVVYPVPLRRPPSRWGTVPPAQRQALARELHAVNLPGLVLLLLVVILLVLSNALTMAADIARGAVQVQAVLRLIPSAVLFSLILLRWRYPLVQSPRKIRDILLNHGRCASCAQDLTDIAAEQDGITVCPHCRAAWRVEPRRKGPPRPAPVPLSSRTITYNPPRD